MCNAWYQQTETMSNTVNLDRWKRGKGIVPEKASEIAAFRSKQADADEETDLQTQTNTNPTS